MAEITITWDDVVALAPELASISAAGQTQVLAQVALQVKPDSWGSVERGNTAAIWLARHLATVAKRRGTGALTGVRVGEVSKSFATSSSKSDLESTAYGAEYLRLVRLWMPRFALT